MEITTFRTFASFRTLSYAWNFFHFFSIYKRIAFNLRRLFFVVVVTFHLWLFIFPTKFINWVAVRRIRKCTVFNTTCSRALTLSQFYHLYYEAGANAFINIKFRFHSDPTCTWTCTRFFSPYLTYCVYDPMFSTWSNAWYSSVMAIYIM